MLNQNRPAVQFLLQEMTRRHLTTVPGFAEVMKQFRITTEYSFEKHRPKIARILNEPCNFVVDIHSPANPQGERHEFSTPEEREVFISSITRAE